MTTFLFWNLNRKPHHDIVANLARQYEVDVIMLAECSVEPALLLITLNPPGTAEYHYAPSPGCTKIEIFTRFLSEFISPIYEEDRLTVRHIKLPGLTDILLAVTHLLVNYTGWRRAKATSALSLHDQSSW